MEERKMMNFDNYLTEVRSNCQFVSMRQLRSCKADVLEYTQYHGHDVLILRSYWTYVCIKIDNLYLVADKHCTLTTWQHVNKFIQDTRDISKGTIICYIDNTRLDKVYIKYMFNRILISFKQKDIIPDDAILPCIADFYKTFAIWLYNYFSTLKCDSVMEYYGHDFNLEVVKKWFGL